MSNKIGPKAKAAKIIEALIERLEYTFFMSRHLELICDAFQYYGNNYHLLLCLTIYIILFVKYT